MYIVLLILILFLASFSFSVLGSYLVLKKISMVADAISHAVLFGIVVAFIFVKDLTSPILIFSAAIVGVLTVFLINYFEKKRNISNESAIGIVMVFFFSLSIILISIFAKNVHLDNDSVLMGDITFAIFNSIYGIPLSIILNFLLSIINLLIYILFKKQIQTLLFDKEYGKAIGYNLEYIEYILIFMLSITIVSNFSTMGSILIVSLVIGPPAIANFYAKSINQMIFYSIIISFFASVIAVLLAVYLNVSISGMIASIIGLFYLINLGYIVFIKN